MIDFSNMTASSIYEQSIPELKDEILTCELKTFKDLKKINAMSNFLQNLQNRLVEEEKLYLEKIEKEKLEMNSEFKTRTEMILNLDRLIRNKVIKLARNN